MQEETADRKNALEGYIYDMRAKLANELAEYVKPEDLAVFSAQLEAMESWLYDEGENETKSTFVAKLAELHKLGEPIMQRCAL